MVLLIFFPVRTLFIISYDPNLQRSLIFSDRFQNTNSRNSQAYINLTCVLVGLTELKFYEILSLGN